MNGIAFDTIDLMTKDQLASELIGRTKGKALVVFEEDDGAGYRCFQSFFSESDPRSKDSSAIAHLFRCLADAFEESDYHPADTGTDKGSE